MDSPTSLNYIHPLYLHFTCCLCKSSQITDLDIFVGQNRIICLSKSIKSSNSHPSPSSQQFFPNCHSTFDVKEAVSMQFPKLHSRIFRSLFPSYFQFSYHFLITFPRFPAVSYHFPSFSQLSHHFPSIFHHFPSIFLVFPACSIIFPSFFRFSFFASRPFPSIQTGRVSTGFPQAVRKASSSAQAPRPCRRVGDDGDVSKILRFCIWRLQS